MEFAGTTYASGSPNLFGMAHFSRNLASGNGGLLVQGRGYKPRQRPWRLGFMGLKVPYDYKKGTMQITASEIREIIGTQIEHFPDRAFAGCSHSRERSYLKSCRTNWQNGLTLAGSLNHRNPMRCWNRSRIYFACLGDAEELPDRVSIASR